MERLQKFLSRAGIASRRHAETLIVDRRVKVNGVVVDELGSRVDPEKDLVTVDGKLVALNPERKYFLFYKPPGVVTTMSDPEGRPTIADYVAEAGGRVFPVGRLDYDAEGALLLTDDGELANKLMHPSHQVPRVYLAKVKGVPDEASLQKLVGGVRLEDGMAHATEASLFDKAERNTWVKIVVTEGRQHLVKRLCAAIGHPVVRLYRPAHAGLPVQGLRPGELRALSNEEVKRVKAVAEGQEAPVVPLSLPARRHGHAAPGFEPERDEDAAPSTGRAPAADAVDEQEERPARTNRAPRPAGQITRERTSDAAPGRFGDAPRGKRGGEGRLGGARGGEGRSFGGGPRGERGGEGRSGGARGGEGRSFGSGPRGERGDEGRSYGARGGEGRSFGGGPRGERGGAGRFGGARGGEGRSFGGGPRGERGGEGRSGGARGGEGRSFGGGPRGGARDDRGGGRRFGGAGGDESRRGGDGPRGRGGRSGGPRGGSRPGGDRRGGGRSGGGRSGGGPRRGPGGGRR